MKVTTVGIDLAKNVLQLHGVDERGKTVLRKQLKRDQGGCVLRQSAAVPDWYGGMRQRAPLGEKAAIVRSHGEVDGPAIRQAVCQDEQERRG